MIRGTLYFVAGAALGGYLVHKVNRTVRAWSPGGIAHRVEDRFTDYRAALREFNEDVGDAIAEHESELRRRFPSAAAPGAARRALEGGPSGAIAPGPTAGSAARGRYAPEPDVHDPLATDTKDGR